MRLPCLTGPATITNNLIIDNFSVGIFVTSDGDATIINNTITSCGEAGIGIHYEATRAMLTNNIIAYNEVYGVSVFGDGPVIETNFNDYWGNGSGNRDLVLGLNDILLKPEFMNPANDDYRLQYNSPCIGAGDNSVVIVATDLDGNPRINGTNVDMGAYEVQCIEVAFDVKPTSCPNPLNVNSKGVLSVAIVGTEDLDVTHIDPASVQLMLLGPVRFHYEDVCTAYYPLVGKASQYDCTEEGPDGFMDMTLKFDNKAIAAALELIGGPLIDGEEILLTLTGNLLEEHGGTPIVGEDVVRIIKKGND